MIHFLERGNPRQGLGGKGANLLALIEAGLPVPPAFCVHPDACVAHLGRPPLAEVLSRTLPELDQAPRERRQALLEEVRRAIEVAPLDAALEAALEQALARLGAARVAVRSSALDEDGRGHSFAGQHDTFLGVAGLQACAQAVRRCWASLWTERAFLYRARAGLPQAGARMAVVVQSLVPADVAGVAFTADPVSGHRERLVLEGSWGLGESVVSGKVTPDRVVLERATLAVLERATAGKSIELVCAEQGVREQPVEEARRAASCLDDTRARRVGELALAAERALGGPQDVEWAFAGSDVFILQARPITTLPAISPATPPVASHLEERTVWTNANTGELLPEVATPMTWSIVDGYLQVLFSPILRRLGIDLGGFPMLGLVAGRVYFNLNVMVGVLRAFPGMRRTDVTSMLGGAQGRLAELGQLPPLAPEDIPRVKVSLLGLLYRVPAFVFWLLRHLPHRSEEWLEHFRALAAARYRLEGGALSDEELLRAVRLDGALTEDALASVAAGVGALQNFFAVCRRWLGDDAGGALANRLLAGVGDLASAQAGLDLWRLAAFARSRPALAQALAAPGSWATLREQLVALPGGVDFLARWDDFLSRHGHHCRGELDVHNPRWRETPDYLLDLLRSYLTQEGHDPVAAHERRGREREELAAQCRQRLRNPLKRWFFGWLLHEAQRGAALRENVKSELVRILDTVRAALLEAGKRLSARGHLAAADDVFFLTLEELPLALRGKAPGDIRDTVRTRRAEHARNQSLSPPPVVVGRFDPATVAAPPPPKAAEVLTGLAVSPGVVEGRARVILSADTGERVLPGEVLVAPFTDPGWTPYFLPAAAIVMDMGGLLSHGSIVAREYGIPAVVNVGPATRIFRTGQLLRVDGTRGEVRLLAESEAA